MSVAEAKKRYVNLLNSIGGAALHAQYPNDFEYYACMLELTDSKSDVLSTFVFTVLPSSISENRSSTSNQKKTAAGVVSIYDTSFMPFDITISGDFGRKLRFFTSEGTNIFTAQQGVRKLSKLNSVFQLRQAVYNSKVKTGYGAIKLLEKMFLDSHTLDSYGNPVRLYFYNLALNSQHLVEFKNFNPRQDESTNMIWTYQISFRAIAPAYSVRQNVKTSVVNLLASSVINEGMDSLADSLRGIKNVRLRRKVF